MKRGDTVNGIFEEYLREKEPEKKEKGYACGGGHLPRGGYRSACGLV